MVSVRFHKADDVVTDHVPKALVSGTVTATSPDKEPAAEKANATLEITKEKEPKLN